MKIVFKGMILTTILVGFYLVISLGYTYYRRSIYLPVRYPFLSSGGFRVLGVHFLDQTQKFKIQLTGRSFDPASVKYGDIVFIRNKRFYLEKFFTNVHPFIHAPYIILSCDGDDAIPGVYAQYLNDEKLIAWIGCNVENINHPKMIPIPIGVMGILNPNLPIDCEEIWGKLLIDIDNGKIQKNKLVYLNVKVKTNPIERGKAVEFFRKKNFCVTIFNQPYKAYLREMATFKFVVSPHGFGLDCYRTWEALMLGCIPIVKKSSLDVLYEGLPVLIVNTWEEVTEELLTQKYIEMSQGIYQYEKLQINYWIKLIRKRIDALMINASSTLKLEATRNFFLKTT